MDVCDSYVTRLQLPGDEAATTSAATTKQRDPSILGLKWRRQVEYIPRNAIQAPGSSQSGGAARMGCDLLLYLRYG
jgi:hypothetical protein